MTWWQDEIQQLREENDQLKQQLANQQSCCQLIAQYLIEKKLTEEATTNNPPSNYVQILEFKAWVEEKAMSRSNITPGSKNLC
jgi:cell division septum initiation protein DivIVA